MAGLDLSPGDPATAVLKGGRAITRGELRALSEQFEGEMQRLGARSAVTCTDDAVTIIAAIDMAGRTGWDLYIAHTALQPEQVDALIAASGIAVRIDDAGVHATGVTAEPPSGAVYMMTSGTSGAPKVAQHTLDSLLRRVTSGRGRVAPAGRWLLTFQPTGFAGVQVQLSAITSGGTVVVPAERTPAGFHEAAVAGKVTHISATPTFWRSLLMLVRPGELDLQQVTLGGEGADQAILDRLRKHFPNARVTHTYASTEAGVVFAVHDGLAGFPSAWLAGPVQGVELRLQDGFLHIRSAALMRRYASGEAQPLQSDGWLATTDRCEVEGERVRILGRDDAMINVAGSKVYPAAVEAVLLSLPEVAEARVYGMKNPIAGMLVAADVVLAAGQVPAAAKAAIQAACRERLASYQQPRMLRIVDKIQVLASGKKAIQ
jgi:acyl-CoA synthetase (AMP-forming)/AMP-acid ligase II